MASMMRNNGQPASSIADNDDDVEEKRPSEVMLRFAGRNCRQLTPGKLITGFDRLTDAHPIPWHLSRVETIRAG
jgi:hypothetical protein